MGDSTVATGAGTCLGRTCLKWTSDGELSPLDLALVMGRLAQVDQELAVLPMPNLEVTARSRHGDRAAEGLSRLASSTESGHS